jgi:hypothetical protein
MILARVMSTLESVAALHELGSDYQHYFHVTATFEGMMLSDSIRLLLN